MVHTAYLNGEGLVVRWARVAGEPHTKLLLRAIMYERITCPATISLGVRIILMIVAELSSTYVEWTSTALRCIMLGIEERRSRLGTVTWSLPWVGGFIIFLEYTWLL